MIDYEKEFGKPEYAAGNKNGGHDRRFRYNPQFPICRHG